VTRFRSLWTRVAGIDPGLADAGLALALTIAMAGVVIGAVEPVAAVALLVMTASLAWRRRWPLGVLIVVFACMVIAGHSDGGIVEVIAVVVATYSAAIYAHNRSVADLVVLAMAAVASALGAVLPVPDWTLAFVLLGSVWVAGTALRRRAERADAMADRASRLELQRDAALQAERTRIARELHDVVTHGVSVMVMQAGAARQQIEHDPVLAETLLRGVEDGGREALGELRRFLGLLGDHEDAAPLSPQPGLDQIETLVARVRAAGVPVELSIEGDARPLPGGIELAAYRVVQEALTNALKHGEHPNAQVRIRFEPRALELEILDDGAGQAGPPGHGLLGMRERVGIYGGTVSSGPQEGHGYAVRARLPLNPGES